MQFVSPARAVVALAAVSFFASNPAFSIPAFPGAEGYGGSFAGTMPAGGFFANGSVYHVTTTADTLDANSKPLQGTLRGAFYDYTNPSSPKQGASNRIVVFDVGGVFNLTNGSLDIKSVNNLYVAGQTAPTPVTVYGNTTQITHSNSTTANTSNVVLRYMTFRRGSATSGNTDSITFAGGGASGIATNMILDHVSSSWSTDEDLSVTNYNTNVTVQYSIIADSLRTDHAYGTLLRAQVDSNVSFHHNLYANNASRQARFGSYNGATLTADFRNNVVYNWRDRVSYSGGASETDTENSHINYVGNYLVAGPSTPAGQTSNTAFTMDVGNFYNLTTNTNTSTIKDPLAVQIYQSGNFIDSNHNGLHDAADTGWGMFVATDGNKTVAFPDYNYAPNNAVQAKMSSAFATPVVTTQSAGDAYNSVINYVGNNWWNRDAIDARIVGNVVNNTNPADGVAATAPNATELANLLATPTVTRAAGFDTDNDGVPNSWEALVGTNPNAADGAGDYDNDGYTNIEEYLNDVGAFPAPAAISFVGTGRFALSGNWDLNWQPSKYDTARINSGTATVDAVGQRAGTLKVGDTPGSNGTLAVTGGWLQLSNTLDVGGAGTGAVNQTGGVVTATNGITLGGSAGASGTYTLSAGTLATPAISPGTTGAAFNFNGGTLSPLASSSAFMPAGTTVKVQSGSARIDTAGFNVTIAAPLLHDAALPVADGGLTKSGAGTLTLSGVNTFTGPTTVSGGKLLLSAGLRNNNSVSILTGTSLEVAANGGASGVSRVRSVSITAGGAWELHNNDLVVDYTGSSTPFSAIVNMVKAGLTSLGGSGSGITSTEVNTGSLPGTTLGVIDDLGTVTSLSGFTLPSPGSSVLVKYTWIGDANLDGVVNGSDYALLDSGFAGGGNKWAQGDFNYDGVVNGSDYANIDTGFSSQSGALPEPGALTAVGAAMLLLLRRRTTKTLQA